jgi:hypothetical protein
MSNKPTTATIAATDAPPVDPTLRLRQLLVWVASVVLAVLATIFILQIGVPAIWPNNGPIPLGATVPISFVNLPLLPLVALPLTFLFVIWVDYFFRAKVVND